MFEESLECVVGGEWSRLGGGGTLGVGHAARAEAARGTLGVLTPGLAASPLRAAHAHKERTRIREGNKDQSSQPPGSTACAFSAAELGAGSGDPSTRPSARALTAPRGTLRNCGGPEAWQRLGRGGLTVRTFSLR